MPGVLPRLLRKAWPQAAGRVAVAAVLAGELVASVQVAAGEVDRLGRDPGEACEDDHFGNLDPKRNGRDVRLVRRHRQVGPAREVVDLVGLGADGLGGSGEDEPQRVAHRRRGDGHPRSVQHEGWLRQHVGWHHDLTLVFGW